MISLLCVIWLVGCLASLCQGATINVEHVVSASDDRTIRLWSVEDGKCTDTLTVSSEQQKSTSVLKRVSNYEMACETQDRKQVTMCSLSRRQCKPCANGLTQQAKQLRLVDANLVFKEYLNGSLQLIALDDMRVKANLKKPVGEVVSLELIDNERLAIGSSDGAIQVWHFTRGLQRTLVSAGHQTAVMSLKTLANSRQLASGAADGTVTVWNLDNGECVRRLVGHSGSVLALETVNGDLLASGSSDRTIRVWDLKRGRCTAVLAEHSGGVTCLKRMKGENRLASGSMDKTIKVWDLTREKCVRTLSGHTAPVRSLETSVLMMQLNR